MEEAIGEHLARHKAKGPTAFMYVTIATLAASAALIAYVLNQKPAASVVIPAAVTPTACRQVAAAANLLHKQRMSRAALGQYYTAWLTKLGTKGEGGVRFTRMTLYNAGIAMAVCLK